MDVGASYAIAAMMLVIALGLAFVAVRINAWLTPDRRLDSTPPYEHGGRTGHKTWVQFRVRYTVLALLFVVFDMEMVYMFPWAVVFKRFGLVGFLDMFVFIAILTAAIAFAWKEGAFDWER